MKINMRFNSSQGNGNNGNNQRSKLPNIGHDLPQIQQKIDTRQQIRQLDTRQQLRQQNINTLRQEKNQVFNQPTQKVQTPTIKMPGIRTPSLQLPGVKLQIPSAPDAPGVRKNDISPQNVRRQVTYDEMYGTTSAKQNELKDKYDRSGLRKKKGKGTVSTTIQKGTSILDSYRNLGRRL